MAKIPPRELHDRTSVVKRRDETENVSWQGGRVANAESGVRNPVVHALGENLPARLAKWNVWAGPAASNLTPIADWVSPTESSLVKVDDGNAESGFSECGTGMALRAIEDLRYFKVF